MLFKDPVRTSKRTPHFTITKINWLTLFKFNRFSPNPMEDNFLSVGHRTAKGHTTLFIPGCTHQWVIYKIHYVVHYRVYKRSHYNPVLYHMALVYTPTPYSLKTHFKIFLRSTPIKCKWYFRAGVQTTILYAVYRTFHTCYMFLSIFYPKFHVTQFKL
jgi:hypothetical protein